MYSTDRFAQRRANGYAHTSGISHGGFWLCVLREYHISRGAATGCLCIATVMYRVQYICTVDTVMCELREYRVEEIMVIFCNAII